MPCLEDLRLRTGQLITEDWFDELADFLCQLGYGGVISVYGYVMQDLVPYIDLALNVGIPLKRFLEVHAGYGYFSGNLWIDGHLVLKDGDCITIGDIEATAKTKIGEAVDDGLDSSDDIEAIKTSVANLDTLLSDVESDIEATKTAVDTLALMFKPVLKGKIWNQFKAGGVDLFGSNLVMSDDGRARIKIESSYYIYTYLVFKADGESVAVDAMLNAGALIPSNAWHEFDFTVMASDEINLRMDQSSTITVLIYNIPNA